MYDAFAEMLRQAQHDTSPDLLTAIYLIVFLALRLNNASLMRTLREIWVIVYSRYLHRTHCSVYCHQPSKISNIWIEQGRRESHKHRN